MDTICGKSIMVTWSLSSIIRLNSLKSPWIRPALPSLTISSIQSLYTAAGSPNSRTWHLHMYHTHYSQHLHKSIYLICTRYYTSCPFVHVCEIHEGLASQRQDNARGIYLIQLRPRVLYLTYTKDSVWMCAVGVEDTHTWRECMPIRTFIM